MAKCTRCCQATTTMTVEEVDGIYKIYSWTCSSCGEHVDMAVAPEPQFELPDYCLVFGGNDAPKAHVVAALPKKARVPSRREVAHV